MADFADWVRAASEGLPFTADEFLNVYMQNRCDSASVSREASPVATAVEKLCIQSRTWRGTATTLLDVLTQYASDEVRRSKEWPKAANRLTNHLRRVRPVLRACGIEVSENREGNERTRTITISSSSSSLSKSSIRASSASSAN